MTSVFPSGKLENIWKNSRRQGAGFLSIAVEKKGACVCRVRTLTRVSGKSKNEMLSKAPNMWLVVVAWIIIVRWRNESRKLSFQFSGSRPFCCPK